MKIKLTTCILLFLFASSSLAQNSDKNPLADFDFGAGPNQQSPETLPRAGQMTPLQVQQHGLTPVIMCTVNGDCNGYTAAQVRAQNINPIVLCAAKTYCQGAINVTQMEDAGLIPSIVCSKTGACGGVTYKEIKASGYTPIIICQSLNDCKNLPFKDKIQYVKVCSALNACGF